ncbi:MAG: EAL domain-containing protein [Oscillospiraceae bacterium]|nr:EAL domain-containing protein [Oscillospiraceae bacterium]MDY2847465.1 EAL domain-containing protein [Oscillospiraceae bacterium]
MNIDPTEYSRALESFIIKSERIVDFFSPDMSDALSDICRVLRAAEVSATLYETPMHERLGDSNKVVFFSVGEPDPERHFTVREMTGGGNVAVYQFLQNRGDENWTGEERDKLAVFEKALFAFNGRSRVMNMIDRLVFFDSDMDIHNLRYFMKTVGGLIEAGRIANYGACFYNLKRFSVINQNIGRERGTVVMRKFAKQLTDKLSEDGMVCRIGGDNFIVLFRKEHLDIVTEHLGGTGIVYDDANNERVLVSAYAGYYMIPAECHNPSEIMDSLSVAVNTAKNILKTSCVFFDEKLSMSRNEIKRVESAFSDAMENEEFKVYYQPKVYLKDYTLRGAEALCRWFRKGEMIPPYRFIPALEQSQSICALDFYMLEHTCRDIRRWLDEGRPVVKVSVNFSRRHLGDMDLLERIISSIDKYNVPHEYIEIELTETTTDVDFSDLREIVIGLREAGISTSIDDFGMGYSSLNLIKELPWNVLKIDKSFLPDENDSGSQKYVMLKHIIALAQDIGLECIVEGVESAEQVRLLKENNCFLAQGFYFDKPLPVGDFEKRLDELKPE